MLPTKLQSGQNFKTATVNKVNEIIDYLKTQRITGDNKTLKVNQLTSGIGLTVIAEGMKKGGGSSSPFNHPFKMSIVEEEGTQYLSIATGMIEICADTNSRSYVMFNDDYKLSLSSLSQDGEYLVHLLIKFNPDGTEDDFGNAKFQCNVYFTTAPITTNYVPSVRGVQTTVIGKIKRETDEDDNVIFSVERQDLISNLFLDYHALQHPFSITAYSDAFTDGSLKNSYSLSDFTFNVQNGPAVINNREINAQKLTFTASQNTYVYCTAYEDQLSAFIRTSPSQLFFHNEVEKTYNYLLGYIEFNAQQFGLAIDQYIYQEVGAGGDTFKVKTIEDDGEAGFLSAKFDFVGEDKDNPLSGYSSSLIGGLCVSGQISGGIEYKVKPIWAWKKIRGYDKNVNQVLIHSSGSIGWDLQPQPLAVSGSLGDWEEVSVLSGKPILRWKPEYISGNAAPFYFMASVQASQGGEFASLSGCSFGSGPEKDAVMLWNRQTAKPYITIPPPSSNISKDWCLVGAAASGVSWRPYKTGSISLSGSMENIFELVDGTSGNILRVKSEYDNSIDQFHFLNLEADGTLSATSFYGDSESDGIASIMCWNYENLEPQVFFCPNERDDDDLILAGSKESGLYWVGLYSAISSEIMELSSYLSGEMYKVKCTLQDPSADFLYYKISSLASSLIISLEEDVDEYVNIDINPRIFH